MYDLQAHETAKQIVCWMRPKREKEVSFWICMCIICVPSETNYEKTEPSIFPFQLICFSPTKYNNEMGNSRISTKFTTSQTNTKKFHEIFVRYERDAIKMNVLHVWSSPPPECLHSIFLVHHILRFDLISFHATTWLFYILLFMR